MFFMTSHNATNKIINITVSVINTTPFLRESEQPPPFSYYVIIAHFTIGYNIRNYQYIGDKFVYSAY